MGHPTGLAVDRRQRLYVAEPGAGVVRVVDLRADRLLRRVAIRRGRPVDVTPDCGRALVLVRSGRDGSLVLIDGRHGPRPGPDLVRPYMLPAGSPLASRPPVADATATTAYSSCGGPPTDAR